MSQIHNYTMVRMNQVHNYSKRFQGRENLVYQFLVVLVGWQGNSNYIMLAVAYHARRPIKGD